LRYGGIFNDRFIANFQQIVIVICERISKIGQHLAIAGRPCDAKACLKDCWNHEMDVEM